MYIPYEGSQIGCYRNAAPPAKRRWARASGSPGNNRNPHDVSESLSKDNTNAHTGTPDGPESNYLRTYLMRDVR